MIGTRFAAALALLLSLAAVALAVTAFMATLRDEELKPGRLVQTRVTGQYEGDPISFPLDDFYASRDANGDFYALYLYPPGYYGHARGCRVIYIPGDIVETAGGAVGPGLFVDPCGGARFGRDGALISGPADRGLDYFEFEAAVEGWLVDTRTLYCGAPYREPTPQPQPPASATPPSPPPATAIPPRPGVILPTETPSPLPTGTATPSSTPTPAASPTEDNGPEKCDRATGSSRRR